MLNKIAHQILSTENPSINLSAKRIINPFRRIVTGKVKMIKSGFTKRFRIDNTSTTIIAEIYPSILTPFNMFAKKNTATAFNNNLKIIFIVSYFAHEFTKLITASKKPLGFSACNQCPALEIVAISALGKWFDIIRSSSTPIYCERSPRKNKGSLSYIARLGKDSPDSPASFF